MEGKVVQWAKKEWVSNIDSSNIDSSLYSDIDQIRDLRKELDFYKSLFVTHNNSCLFNMNIKTVGGKKVWVDPIRDSHKYISNLDKDKEVYEWLKPIKCAR